MKIFLFTFLVLTGLSSQAQSKKQITKNTITEDTYVRTGTPNGQVFCGLQPSTRFIHKKRIIFTSPEVSFDIKILKRSEESWEGRDKEGIEYVIIPVTHAERPDEPAILFLPEPGSGKLGVMISRYQICK